MSSFQEMSHSDPEKAKISWLAS